MEQGVQTSRTPDRPRGLIVCRDYWPVITDRTLRLVTWCKVLQDSAIQVDVLCMRPRGDWSERIEVGGTRVIRVDGSQSAFRIHRGPARMMEWLQKNSAEYAFIYFDELSLAENWLSHSNASKNPSKLAVRYLNSDLRIGNRLRKLAQEQQVRLTVPDRRAHQSLIAAGIGENNRVVRIDDFGVAVQRSIGARRKARLTLGLTCGELHTHAQDRVIIVPIPVRDWQWQNTLEALGKLSESYPQIRAWLLGDCTPYTALLKQIRHAGWQYAITTPGVFTDFDLPLQAADLVLLDQSADSAGWFVPTLCSSHIPMLLAKGETVNERIPEAAQACLFEAGRKNELYSKLVTWANDPTSIERASDTLHNQAVQTSLKTQHRLIEFFGSLYNNALMSVRER